MPSLNAAFQDPPYHFQLDVLALSRSPMVVLGLRRERGGLGHVCVQRIVATDVGRWIATGLVRSLHRVDGMEGTVAKVVGRCDVATELECRRPVPVPPPWQLLRR